MGSVVGKGSNPTTGFRYYFSMLMGVCRGPVDQVFLITSGDAILWDGAGANALAGGLFTSGSGGGDDPAPLDQSATDWPGGPVTVSAQGIPLLKPNLYGGDQREGGVVGQMDVQMGEATQTLSSKIAGALAGLRVSALRGVLTIFYDGEVCANNPYPKPWKFRVRRALKGWDGDVWYPETAVIMLSDPAIPAWDQTLATALDVGNHGTVTTTLQDGSTTRVVTSVDGSQTYTSAGPDGTTSYVAVPQSYNQIYAANGAHIIYECCTNRDWGRGLDRALMDDTSFRHAADRLYTEQFGLCLKWSRADDVDTFIQSVIDHIGAVLYTDKVTGFLCLKLLRADYNAGALVAYDYTHGLLGVTSSETAAIDTSANEIIVKYNSPVLNADKEARAQNIASINAHGSVFSTTRQYPGIPTSTLAVLVAQRDLKVFSAGLRRITVKLDRRAYLLVPGDVIKVNAPDQGIPNMVLRVASIEDSVVTDGTITVTGAQDSFSQPLTPFVAQPQATFREPDLWPHPIVEQQVALATYRDLYKLDGTLMDSERLGTGVPRYARTEDFVFLMARAPSPASLGFDLWGHASDPGAKQNAAYLGQSSFALLSFLTTDLKTTDTVFPVTGDFTRTNPRGGTVLLIGTYGFDEWGRAEFVILRSSALIDGVLWLTVGRGCIDTPSRRHTAGTRVWAYDDVRAPAAGEPRVQYGFTTVYGRTRTSRGVLPLEAATAATEIMTERQAVVYSGANFRVNGYPRDQMAPHVGPDLVCTWNHRSRILQADQVIDEYAASVGPEPLTTYRVRVFAGTDDVFGTNFDVPVVVPPSSTITITGSQLASAGFSDGPMTAELQTRTTDPYAYGYANVATDRFTYASGGAGYGVNYGNYYGG